MSLKIRHDSNTKEVGVAAKWVTNDRPGLEVLQLLIDLLDINIHPQDIIVAIHSVNDIIVETVELLQEVQLLLDLDQLWVLSDWETKEFLSSSVGDVLPVECVKAVLEDDQSVGGFSRSHTRYHRTSLQADMVKM